MIERDNVFQCPIEVTIAVVGGKWKVVILWHLRKEPKRPAELKRLMPNISDKMLTQQLRELEADGIVGRTVHREGPPRVDYFLTELGQSMLPMLDAIGQWGMHFVESLGDAAPTVVVLENRPKRERNR